MSLTFRFFVTFLLCFSITQAQHVREDYNLLGIHAGATLFNINTSDFNTQQGTGIFAGFVTHGDVYNNLDLEYGIGFFQNQVGIFGRRYVAGVPTNDAKYIAYELSGVQVKFLGSLNIVKHYLSVDFGPILNVNGKLKLKQDGDKDYILEGYDSLSAADISNISRIHFHLAAGITAGLKHFRLNAQYQYGVTNIFNRFNDLEAIAGSKPEGGFKGNASLILLGGYVFF